MRRTVGSLVCLAALAACGGEEPMSADRPWPSAAERTMREGHAPTPFTAEQIREACPVGRRSTYQIELPGRTPFLQVFTFLLANDEGVQFETSIDDPEAAAARTPTSNRTSWKDLQSHASFPAEATTISQAEVEVPAGSYACLLYRVRGTGGEGTETRAWFAFDLPGPPVRMVTRRDGQVVMTMTLVDHVPGR